MTNKHLIRSVTALPGERPVLAEPIVGRWYCGMTIDTDMERGGILVRYEGEGQWADEEEFLGEDVHLGDYDYLQEQH